MDSITQYLGPVNSYDTPSPYSSNNDSPFIKLKVLEADSLQEKVNILSQQISSRKKLLSGFEKEAQSRINQLNQQKIQLGYYKQDISWIENAITKIKMDVQDAHSRAWKDIRELEIELTDFEFQFNKRKVKNSMTYQSSAGVYGGSC